VLASLESEPHPASAYRRRRLLAGVRQEPPRPRLRVAARRSS